MSKDRLSGRTSIITTTSRRTTTTTDRLEQEPENAGSTITPRTFIARQTIYVKHITTYHFCTRYRRRMRRINAFSRICLSVYVRLFRPGSTFWKLRPIETSFLVCSTSSAGQIRISRFSKSRPRSRSHEQKSMSVCPVLTLLSVLTYKLHF